MDLELVLDLDLVSDLDLALHLQIQTITQIMAKLGGNVVQLHILKMCK